MRRLGKILFLIFAAALLISGALLAYFNSWKSSRISQLQHGSQIAQTIAGKIEFAQTGTGPFVLVFHGAPGGYDQGLLLGRNLIQNGFQVIAPSRPGYLRTPLETGLTPEDQADAMAALLDTLGVGRVAVLGFSLGGPAAIQFAVRHPDRVQAVVLVSTVIKACYPAPTSPHSISGELTLNSVYSDANSLLLSKESAFFPGKTIQRMLACETAMDAQEKDRIASAIAKNPDQLAWFRALVATTTPEDIRHAGFTNDVVQLRGLPDVSFDPIQAPLLIIHGVSDADTPISEVKRIMSRLSSAQFLAVEDSGPIVWLGPNARTVNDKILSFLQANTH